MTDGDYLYPRGLFSAAGVELEYMVVDRESLDIMPVVDELFKSVTGRYDADVEPDGPGGGIGWSNELALHVFEMKTIEPVPSLDGLHAHFGEHVRRVNGLLAPFDACLLPTAMHPWMDPHTEARLWPHDAGLIYHTFDRIFGCSGHGWTNLQSSHINLPFASDDEFGRLHAAIRLVLPLIPALAASSPIMDGVRTPYVDARLDVYKDNAVRVPSVAGRLIPEPVFTRAGYEQGILERIYADLAPLDPEGVLRHEWANARACIARFERGSIEIRLLDVQECPLADLAVAAMIVEAVKAHANERWIDYARQRAFDVEPLRDILMDTITGGEDAIVRDRTLLHAFGVRADAMRAGELWAKLQQELLPDHPDFAPVLQAIATRGTLSTRIKRALGLPKQASNIPIPRAQLRDVYAQLAACLDKGTMFLA